MQRINLRPYDEVSRFITQECLRAYTEEDENRVSDLVFRLLRSPHLPMHCPQRHYLIPAATKSVPGTEVTKLSCGGCLKTL